MTPGLRERKKQQTREAIVQAALRLFAEHGFAATTLPAIAEAADVSPRTVSSYFPVKEDLVFADAPDMFASLTRRLTDRRPGEHAIDALRGWILDLMDEFDAAHADKMCQRRLIESDPQLRAHERQLHGRVQEIVASAIAEDLDAAPSDLAPRMAAAAAMAVLEAIGDEDCDELKPVRPRDESMAMIDQALGFVRAGIASLR